jgi:hypothetical protein
VSPEQWNIQDLTNPTNVVCFTFHFTCLSTISFIDELDSGTSLDVVAGQTDEIYSNPHGSKRDNVEDARWTLAVIAKYFGFSLKPKFYNRDQLIFILY